MKHTFTGWIEDKSLAVKLDGMRYNSSVLESLLGKELTVSIDTKKKPRSVRQNAWYWGVAVPTIIARLRDFDGEDYTKEVIHEYILQEIIHTDGNVVRVLGRPIITYSGKTTSQMNTEEFNQFKLKLQEFFAIKDIQIPDPNE